MIALLQFLNKKQMYFAHYNYLARAPHTNHPLARASLGAKTCLFFLQIRHIQPSPQPLGHLSLDDVASAVPFLRRSRRCIFQFK